MPLDYAKIAIDRINDELAHTKRRLKGVTNPGLRYELEATVASLEQELVDQRARNRMAQADKDAREQELADKVKASEAAFEDDLKARFRRIAPYGSDADFQAMRPRLLADIAAEKRAKEERERSTYSFVPDGAVIID